MAGLLGQIYSAGNVARRKLTDLLGNPVESAQQIVGNLNDRARVLNQMTAAAAREGVNYGPASRQLAGLLADAYNPMGMVVYHGSPAKFSRFDPKKIGSGEGAQAYGYGHYVAQSPSVAKEYRTALSEPELFKKGRQIKTTAGSNMDTAKAWLQDSFESGASNPFEDAIAKVAASPIKQKEEVISALQKLQSGGVQMQKGGFEYEIDLPDEQIAKMLKWDEPLSKQTPEIQALAKQYGLTDFDHLGGDLVAAMNAKRPAGAEAMRQAGIPGISYYDQGSRVAAPTVTDKRLLALYEKHNQDPVAAVDEFMRSVYNTPKKKEQMRQSFIEQLTAPKTSNFVVFPGNEDLLTILRRNGGLLD